MMIIWYDMIWYAKIYLAFKSSEKPALTNNTHVLTISVSTIKFVSVCMTESEFDCCFIGPLLVFLNIANAISAFTKCYPANGQNYCFYTDGSVLSWNEAREFCASRNSTLPIITDEDIDNVFQRFISDNNNQEVSGSDTEQMNNYVWLDAHARHVDDSVKWHWINGQTSG